MTDGLKRLTLELDSDAEPISGRMRDENGSMQPFVGWLGLASLLSAFAGEPAARPAARPRESRDRRGRRR